MNWKYAVGDTVKIIKEVPWLTGNETNFRTGDKCVVKKLCEYQNALGPSYKLQGDQPFWFWFESELELCVPEKSFDGIEELL